MKLSIYNTETKEVVAIVNGETDADCEDKAFNYLGVDEYAGTYSPAFGTVDGLIESDDVEVIE